MTLDLRDISDHLLFAEVIISHHHISGTVGGQRLISTQYINDQHNLQHLIHVESMGCGGPHWALVLWGGGSGCLGSPPCLLHVLVGQGSPHPLLDSYSYECISCIISTVCYSVAFNVYYLLLFMLMLVDAFVSLLCHILFACFSQQLVKQIISVFCLSVTLPLFIFPISFN